MAQDADRLRERVELQFECRATFRRSVIEPASDELHAAQLQVHIFDLEGHPFAKCAYAWEEDGTITAMQHAGFIKSPRDAVREAHAAIG